MSEQHRAAPAQVLARVVHAADAGAYRRLVLASAAASHAAPGQFVAVAVGDRTSSLLLRRAFSVHRADPSNDLVEVVVAAHGPGTAWIAGRQVGDVLDVVGPLGAGFDLPAAPGRLVLVGGGYGSAPFAWTAQAALAAGLRVDAVVGAADAARLCDVDGIRAVVETGGGTVHVTTDDGSTGRRGRVTDALADLLSDAPHRGDHAQAVGDHAHVPRDHAHVPRDHALVVTVAACGPMAMLRAVTRTATESSTGAPVRVQVAVEEAMACGFGVCMTCVLPVRGDDGVTRMVRSCTAGPVLDGERVRWDAIGPHGASVPVDAWGAPEGGAR